MYNYRTRKKLEYCIKGIKHGQEMSCIPPVPYSNRFQRYMDTIFTEPAEHNS